MLIDIVDLSFAYGHRIVLKNLSLSLSHGDFLIVRGKNGSGKSTLVKCLLGINPVKSGMIFFEHADIVGFRGWPKIGYVPQKSEDFNYEFPITVNEILTVSSRRSTKNSQKLKLLDKLGILPLLNENINNLSAGQQQRVFIVRAMLNEPSMLILDEPTASIDLDNIAYFQRAVNELHDDGVTVILISHDEAIEEYRYTHILTLDSESDFTFRNRAQHIFWKEGIEQ